MIKDKIISISLVVLVIMFIPIFITTILTGIGRVNKNESTISVKINYNGYEETVDLEDYLVGVVAAEMPVNFELEALKAQAVAARTYTLKRLKENPEIVFTKDIQSYESKEELDKKWTVNDYAINYAKIKNAVDSTRGIVMVYDGELIDAVFHSTSTGMTQSAKDVWGKDIPYLQAVESLEDINSPYYLHKYTFTINEFIELVNNYDKEVEISNDFNSEVQIIERNDNGYVNKIQVGNKVYTGEVFRKILNLASSNFIISYNLNEVEITCKGYGHGVGLSQYGAEALAIDGYTYKDILKHYYKDILIKNEY